MENTEHHSDIENLKIFKCRHQKCRRDVGATNGEKFYVIKDGHLTLVPFEPHFIKARCANDSFEHFWIWERKQKFYCAK